MSDHLSGNEHRPGEAVLRPWREEDLPEMKEIFAASAGDSPEEIEAFYRHFLTGPEACTVAAEPEEGRPEGRAAAAGYALPGIAMHWGGTSARISRAEYLYGLGCLPSRRGRGYGMRLHEAMFAEAGKQGILRCMIPATDGLLQVYERFGKAVPLGRIRKAELSREECLAAFPGAEGRAAETMAAEKTAPEAPRPGFPEPEWLTPEEYARRREAVLAPYPHAEYPAAWYALMADYGDRFAAWPGALAALIPAGDRRMIAELLCCGADPERALAGIAAACPAERIEIRTPLFFPGPGEVRPFAYCNLEAAEPPEDFWFPFGLE